MRETVSLDKEIGDGTITVGDTLSDDGESPEEAVLRLERRRQLLAALNGLPEMFREAVVLCDVEGLGYEEVARVLGINIGTVKSRLARGREQLRKRLGGF